VGVKLVVPSAELAGSHYAEHENRPFYPKLVNFLSSGPVLAMVRCTHPLCGVHDVDLTCQFLCAGGEV
jgi:nucleoside diphosphate kinase